MYIFSRIKTKQLLHTRLSFAGFSCLPQYPPHFRGLQLINDMGSLPGIYFVQYFTTSTFISSFCMRDLSTTMSNHGDDKPDHPIRLGFEIWEIVHWSHRLTESWATRLWSHTALFPFRVLAHFCVHNLSQVVWGMHQISAGYQVSWSWKAAYTCSPCLHILQEVHRQEVESNLSSDSDSQSK